MARLPFVVQPRLKAIIERVGSEESGIIEVERRGYLTSGEKAFVQQVQTQDGGTVQLITLSRKISQEKDIGLEKSYNMVLDIITGRNKTKFSKEIESEYVEEFQATLNALTSSKVREDLIQAACLLIYRVDSTLSINDVMDVHPDIIAGLSQLFKDEEAQSIERLQNAEQAEQKGVNLDEIEKKQEETPVQ